MRNCIITIDDFGISEKMNEAARTLIQAGAVDRVAVMPHGSVTPNDVSFLLNSGVKIDIHLDRNPVIPDSRELRGSFFGRITTFLAGHITGELSPKSVRATWEEQILAFQKQFGRLPDGLNSHEHVHFFPSYFTILVGLAKKYGIGHVRFGRHRSGILRPVPIVLDRLRFLNRKAFRVSGLDTSDYLISADWLPGLDIGRHMESLPDGVSVEYIFHPEREEELAYLLKKNDPARHRV
ncbi:MAG: ChbG/HpnK family deacetylase [Candidatus Moranbacteria bacterium]|nr:ChbG/HpnK family deacetylase [Candidatus Moranbacteria bacterium]